MKQLLSFILFLVCLTAGAENFQYTYEGQTLTYIIINEEAKTCGVGTEYEISGEVVIPSEAKNDRGSYKVTSIVRMAFSDCPGLTSITIPNSVTDIGGDAFGRCTGLKSVTIPNSVTNIGYDAFSGCTGLTNITIPNSVRTIESYAFYNCTGLTSITIPNSVTNIGNNVFKGCTSLEKLIIEDGTETLALGYHSSEKDFFPDCPLRYLYLGRSLSYSSQSAESSTFYNKSTLKEVTISNSVTSIGNNEFYGCSGLTSITIPNSVTTIGYNAFNGCTGLKSVTIPNSVTSIGNNTFQDCTTLTELIIEDGTLSLTLGDDSFSNCPLISIRLGRNILYNYTPFPNNSTLKYVTISKSVTEIKNAIFYGCTSLENLIIEDGTETLNTYGTFSCPLRYLYLGRNLSYDLSPFGLSPFYEKSTLKEATIGNFVTSIGNYTFYRCTGLTSITIPNSVFNIGRSAFYGCSGLTNITIPDNITTIDDYVFDGCSSLTSIKIPNSVTTIGYYAFEDCSSLTSIEIPNGITTIGDYAFYGCSGLTRVSSFSTIPPKFTQYGFDDSVYQNATLYVRFDAVDKYKNADVWRNFKNIRFLGETELIYRYDDSNMTATVVGLYKDKLPADLVIPEIRTLNDNTYSVVAINDNIFQDCTDLTSVEIPNSVTTIGAGTFQGCTGLTSVEIPNSITTIGAGTFQGCTGLTSVKIPNSVTTIGAEAFQGCTDLTSVEIPNSVTTIGAGAFQGCTDLTSVKIPNSVTSIDYLAFADCSALTTIYSFNTTPPSIDYETFAVEAYDNATLYVPNEAVEAYQNAEYWGLFWDIRGFDATGIKGVEATISSRKDSYYDINGRKLSAPQRGLNIINGRKVLLK